MISDLLDVSRIISGKMRLDVQLVDFAETIEAALASVSAAAVAKDIQLAKVLDPRAGPISGDPARLQQIVWNLVSNAVKFTPKGGRVRISLQRVNSHVELSVADNGLGMPAELVPHVFERFHQGDASTSRGHGGLGLGLAIVKQLVELHGGAIRAASEGMNKGATFTVTIPLASVHATQAIDGAGKDRASLLGDVVSLAGVRVLVVDDDEDARRLTSRVLMQAGADVDAVSNVEDALTSVGQRQPHVLVSDLGMPVRDGFELIREVRGLGYSFQELPAVALTAFARTDDRRRALLAGFQVHLAKPVDPKELAVVVASLVGRTEGA
jgi:CheY-like chemotaxis protein